MTTIQSSGVRAEVVDFAISIPTITIIAPTIAIGNDWKTAPIYPAKVEVHEKISVSRSALYAMLVEK